MLNALTLHCRITIRSFEYHEARLRTPTRSRRFFIFHQLPRLHVLCFLIDCATRTVTFGEGWPFFGLYSSFQLSGYPAQHRMINVNRFVCYAFNTVPIESRLCVLTRGTLAGFLLIRTPDRVILSDAAVGCFQSDAPSSRVAIGPTAASNV